MVYMEAVEVDPVTLQPVVNANLAGDWANRASLKIDGTSSSTTALEVVGDSAPSAISVSVGSQPTSSGTIDYLLELHPQDAVTTAVSANSGGSRGTIVV
ncbi:hypothetical protein [Pararhizobium sp. A13]|uniref:hypothetical protein n=1 Tax=Pararhizobium sp. A13 TaxID=3133975 RepID=UPI0032554E1F